MLRLNRLTDYAILVMGALAMRADGNDLRLISSTELASATNLNQPTIAKLVKLLTTAGLVHSQRGVGGGCRLSKPVSEISVAEVVIAVEGPIALTDCVEGATDPCAVQQGCFLSGHWNRINAAIYDALKEVSLAELFDPSHMFPADLTADLTADLKKTGLSVQPARSSGDKM